MKIYLCVFLFFCGFCCSAMSVRQSQPEHIRLANEIIHKYGTRLVQTYGFSLTGQGGKLMFDIEELSLHFKSHKELSLDDTRRLYVEIVDNFLSEINQNQQAQPFLHSHPFTANNVSISIVFYDQADQPYQNNKIAMVNMVNGKVIYSIYDKKIDHYRTIATEDYGTARAKL